ncbi:MAG: hypothetical protein HKO57_02125, partial [Akkermansiaceae bacterium]|nr:hypothetical protein [Akkermansiaceae bacterium]
SVDGIAIGDDGQNWRMIWDGPGTIQRGVWTPYSINLGQAARDSGISLNSTFGIRFQQVDDHELVADGRGWDDLRLLIPQPTADWYSFSLAPGDEITVAMVDLSGGDLDLELYDPGGALVATGVGADNLTRVVRNVTAAQGGLYAACISGGGTEDYSLVVVRNGEFDVESNDSIATAQVIGHDDNVLGAVACPPSLFVVDWVLPTEQFVLHLDSQTGELIDKFALPITDSTSPHLHSLAHDGQHLWYSGGQVGGMTRLHKIDPESGAVIDFVDLSIPHPLSLAWLDGEIYVGDDTDTIRVFDDQTFALNRSFPVDVFGDLSGLAGDAKRGIIWVSSLFQRLYQVDPLTGAILSDVPKPRIGGERGLSVICDEVISSEFGHHLRIRDAETLAIVRDMDLDHLIKGQIAGAAGENNEPSDDWYAFTVNQAGPIDISTMTPSRDTAQPGEFHNVLDPAIELYDDSGLLVAGDGNSAPDGVNAQLSHHATSTGTYRVRVIKETGAAGEYVLSVDSPFSPGADGDGDGINDGWEMFYWGNLAAADASSSHDTDLHTDLEEYIADTDPTDPNSCFQIKRIVITGDAKNVHFDSSPNRVYTLQFSDDLQSWSNVPNQVLQPGQGPNDVMSDTTAVPKRFYRMEVSWP